MYEIGREHSDYNAALIRRHPTIETSDANCKIMTETIRVALLIHLLIKWHRAGNGGEKQYRMFE